MKKRITWNAILKKWQDRHPIHDPRAQNVSATSVARFVFNAPCAKPIFSATAACGKPLMWINILTIFQQAEQQITRRITGTGSQIAICREIEMTHINKLQVETIKRRSSDIPAQIS